MVQKHKGQTKQELADSMKAQIADRIELAILSEANGANAPVDITPAAIAAAKTEPPTEASLMAEMQKAIASGDYKLVAKVASQLVTFQKSKEAAELAAKQQAAAAMTERVKATIQAALAPMVEAGELDSADGIWYTQDFGEKLITCRLLKAAPKAERKAGTPGGTGKKFAMSTTDLMAKHGGEVYKDGQTFQAAWDSNSDKNFRYAIREALLKAEGLIS